MSAMMEPTIVQSTQAVLILRVRLIVNVHNFTNSKESIPNWNVLVRWYMYITVCVYIELLLWLLLQILMNVLPTLMIALMILFVSMKSMGSLVNVGKDTNSKITSVNVSASLIII